MNGFHKNYKVIQLFVAKENIIFHAFFRYYCDPTHDPHSFYGVGLANKNVEVTLPLSSEVALFSSRQGHSGYAQGKNAYVKDINKRTILAASRFVFVSEKSDTINKLVQKCIGSAPRMRVDGI